MCVLVCVIVCVCGGGVHVNVYVVLCVYKTHCIIVDVTADIVTHDADQLRAAAREEAVTTSQDGQQH